MPKTRFQKLLPWIICGLAAVFYSYEYLLRISTGVMVPQLMQAFSVSATALGNLNAFYYYAYTPMQMPVGVMMDRYGPRRILTLAVFLCAIGTTIFGSTTSLWVAAAGRFLIGFGSAFAFVGVMKLASIWLPPDRFAMVSGLATSLGMVGAIFGSLALSDMVEKVGWSDTIVYSSYFGFLLLPMIWFMIRDQNHQNGGAAGTSNGNEVTSYKILAKQLGKILQSKQIWINGIVGCLLYLPTTVFGELWGVEYMAVVHHMDHSVAVRAVSMIFFGWAIGGPIAGWISDKMHRRRSPMILSSFIAALLLMVVMYCALPVWAVFAFLFLFGVVSSFEVICFAIGRENCPQELAGTSVATTNFLIMIGGAVCQPLVGKILDLSWNGTMVDGLRIFKPDDYQWAMLILPIGLVSAGILSFFLKETYARAYSLANR